ncbi:NADH:ubiquinone oxidoreductase [Photobacterium sp. 53610]|uniref:NADH:ubiquinone oxidoreductase n=1 Tax=Photobacterium sp. 53610 TaxID=3102789 RepID=UPI002EDAAA66
MKFLFIFLVSVVAAVLSGEHFHSFMAGFGVASLAVGVAYWLAFRSTRYPQLAFMLLLSGLMAKMGVTVLGVMWGLENQIINSPLVFALSYLFFSVVATYIYFKLREFQLSRIETAKLANA